jgi:hypothetical protein
MVKLSTAFPIELNELKLEVYWDALSDLRIDGIVGACQHLARHWSPTYAERFPVPATIREAVRQYREAQRALGPSSTAVVIPARTETPDEEALAHLHDIVAMLDAKMEMRQGPRPAAAGLDPEEREALIAAGQLNPPDPRRWLPLVDEDGRPYHHQKESDHGE